MPRTAPRGKEPERGPQIDKQKYIVVGDREVGGAKPGEFVDMELTVERARSLVQAGHIAVADTTKEQKGEVG